ncbi:M1 family metallopeptidase [Paenibacillus sp. SYP-B4298]|uniref:M1 family metallopeptidase n=1 Tax=Paenibacillus sp. SYP-B4298 TaxID=2996034 RepID=UPI0022DE7877|nr:M1 family metallopeptidase [Paenibacillus sp. SYP-B4298]
MIPRRTKGIVAAILMAILIGASLQQGFGDAWQSAYTYAFAPAAPPASSLADSTMLHPKPELLPAAAKPEPAPPASRMAEATVTEQPVPPPKPEPLSTRVAEYHINVHLHNDEKLLHGQQTVTWTNPGKREVSELYFHLYPNAFESPRTTFMRESGGKLRQDKATAGSYGFMKLESLTTTEGESLLPRLHYVQPDDGNEQDRTLAKLRLPEPVPPGASITLSLGFQVKLPQVFARMGYAGDFIMAGQWFPKLAKFETAGTRGRAQEGWNIHQYHGNSEFYSDFGIYNVKISVPSGYTVAATGFPSQPATDDGKTKTYQFYADDVHDFAWAASPDFIYAEEPYSAPGVPGVRIKLYLDPLHENLKDRYLHAAKSALAKYAQWYGEYPYSTLSIVVPPKGGNGAGGMEYPTLVTAFEADTDNPGYELERVIVHEIGHQYWYGMVATNEFEEAWLDEGLTSYSEDKVMESEYGVAPQHLVEASYLTHPAPLKLLSWSYRDHEHYAENVYMRAKLVLVDIEKQVGEKAMRKMMRTYFQKYKFKHPSTADFQKTLEQVTRKKWDDYFRQYVYGSLTADFSVESIEVRPAEQERTDMYESIVVIRKNGGDYGEIPILFQFKDGTALSKAWDGASSHIQFKLLHTAPLAFAVVDPQHTMVLDNKRINNFLKSEVLESSSTRWNLGIVKVIEGLLGSLSW